MRKRRYSFYTAPNAIGPSFLGENQLAASKTKLCFHPSPIPLSSCPSTLLRLSRYFFHSLQKQLVTTPTPRCYCAFFLPVCSKPSKRCKMAQPTLDTLTKISSDGGYSTQWLFPALHMETNRRYSGRRIC